MALEALFELGVKAARSGQQAWARDLFRRVVEADGENYQAWLWLASVSEGEERRACVTRMLALTGGDGDLPAAGSDRGLVGKLAVWLHLRGDRTALLETVWPAVATLTILVLVVAAELMTSLADPRVGLALHGMVLIVLLLQVALAGESGLGSLFLALTLVPIIRILSLALPLIHFPVIYWYAITSVPLFASAWVAARSLGYSRQALGLTLHGWPLQLAVGLSGLALGAVEWAILRPEPLVPELSLRAIVLPALILLVGTGLLEELIFRGVLQQAAGDALGRWGMPYVALLFAALHLGYQSIADVAFVLAVGLFFGAVVQRTRSLLGVTLAHGLANVMLFLVMPFVLG